MGMFKIAVMSFFVCMIAAPVFGQEKTVENFTVSLGILSWEQIQREVTEKPASHSDEYHNKMAKEMAKMHGGGKKGTYHLLVVIGDRKTGKRIEKADVEVHVNARFGPQKEMVKLRSMTMEGYAGFGNFIKIDFSGPYALRILFRLSDREAFKEVEFVRDIRE